MMLFFFAIFVFSGLAVGKDGGGECKFVDSRGVPVMKPNVPRVPLEYWPGERLCVSCNLVGGIIFTAIEVAILYVLLKSLSQLLRVNAHTEKSLNLDSGSATTRKLPQWLDTVTSIFGWIVASALGFYWAAITLTFLNFISWLFLTGIFIVLPGLYFDTYMLPSSSHRSELMSRRVKLSLVFLGAVTLAVFPNIFLFPQQMQRRMDPSNSVLLPDHPLVLELRAMFYSEIPEPEFRSMHFYDQMYAVDKFIFRKIIWHNDYGVYHLAGLLLSPVDVISSMSGDCQGQAVTTASLLMSMGFDAWVVETPFHWWTHAEDPVSGLVANLNYHGEGGQDGNVRPQPIDLVYTRPRPQCTDCPYMFAADHEPLFYAAPPHRAWAIALTGTHIYVRSGFTLDQISMLTLTIYGLAFGSLVAFYATYFQADVLNSVSTCAGFTRLMKRFLVSCVVTVVPLFFGMATWATVYYPFTTIHAFGVLTFGLTFVSGNYFNELIGWNSF